MGLKWKRFLFPGISGALVGIAAVLARRRSRRRRSSGVRHLRDNRKRIIIVTEEQSRPYRGQQYLAQMIYGCEPTRFKVWRFLRPSTGDSRAAPSQGIYHITPVIEFKSSDGEDAEVLQEEQFYATIHSVIDGRLTPDAVARDAFIEFHQCHVGGSMNGIETGAKVASRSPVAYYEFVDQGRDQHGRA